MLYANYLRNKMRHLVKTLFSSGYPLKIISKFEKKAVDYTIHGNTETGKNILSYPYSGFGGAATKTVNGITFTDNGDGSITLNGTSTAEKYFEFMLNTDFINSIDKTKTYTMSVTGADKTKITFEVLLFLNTTWVENVCTTNYPTCDFSAYTKEFDKAKVALIIKQGASFENATIKPMIEVGAAATEYEPYVENYVGDKTKNIIPYQHCEPLVLTNGITFTDNGDGTITANGTATGASQYFLRVSPDYFKFDKNATYILSGCPSGGTLTTYRLEFFMKQDNTDVLYKRDTGNGVVINNVPENYDSATIKIMIYSGITVNNLVFKPQIEIGETATEYEPYGCKIPITNTGKNLIPYPYSGFGGVTTKTVDGITFTDNGDGTIAINGTTSENEVKFRFITSEIKLPLDSNNYVLSGKVGDKAYVYTQATSGDDFYMMMPSSIFDSINTSTYNTLSFMEIICAKNTEFNNVVIKPQFERGETEAATEYEPYREPQTTTIYRTSQLKDGESISRKADNLPDLQLCEGENNITADTEVKPTAIDVKYLN